jgi:lipopolysaccharide export system protein LptA
MLDPRQLRKLFALGAVLAILAAAGFYLRGIVRNHRVIKEVPRKIAENIARSGTGFTYSQSEGGRTLFTIHAASFQQYKEPGRTEGGKAELHDVSITVYGRENNRADQIHGADFLYDPESGDVTAKGEVHIDLEADVTVNAAPNQDPATESQNVIHVMTSGLTFNRKSGIAQTAERIEFRIPGASGSAIGAQYNSHESVLNLKSAVRLVTTEKQKATITAQSANIRKDPRQIVLQAGKLEQQDRTMSADKVVIALREDSTVERVSGIGSVRAVRPGDKGFEISAPQADLYLVGTNQPRSAEISGGVQFERRGDSPAQGKAGKVLLSFDPKGQISKGRAEQGVDVTQGTGPKSEQLKAAALDLFVKNGRTLDKAVTSSGPGEMVLNQGTTKTAISAGQFEARFGEGNQLSYVVGSPDAKIVSTTPGQAERTATARELVARFNGPGQITSADLTGAFHYEEGQRTATAERAHYNVTDDSYELRGSPRVVDSGVALTADTIQLNRKTGMANGQGNVKTTYNDLKAAPGGAMLSSSDPIHVTGSSVNAGRSSGVARYTEGRLWQGANIVEAPTLVFDKNHRTLQAQGNPSRQIATVFVQPEKSGKTTPVSVTADKLTYVDGDRKAVFSGNVVIKSAETTMNANTVQVFLLARGGAAGGSGNQLDRIVAQGDIQIHQGERRAQGSQVVYTAQEQKFVLTGTPEKKPSIFDAEHGQITGDSLTFYTQGDRVLVGSGNSSPTLTQTRNRDTSKK